MALISLVYTDPDARGQGLASRCVEACLDALHEEAAPLVLLWSDRPTFYERLGFHCVGKERLFALDRSQIQRARGRFPAPLEVEPWCAADLPVLEAMYAARTIRADRDPGALESLLSGPSVEGLVARNADGTVGYAVLGRGDDFPEIVHEWAGASDAVLACLERFAATRPVLGLLGGPRDEGPIPSLAAAGAGWHESHFAMAKLLDPEALFRAATRGAPAVSSVRLQNAGPDAGRVQWAGEEGHVEISEAETLRLILGGPGVSPAQLLDGVCCEAEQKALSALWPWPLYLWGFDSI